MGKASRLKAEKRKAPPPVGKRPGPSQRAVLFGTLGLPSLAMAIWPARKLSLDSYWLGRTDRFAIGDA